jgi:hypothetical protein
VLQKHFAFPSSETGHLAWDLIAGLVLRRVSDYFVIDLSKYAFQVLRKDEEFVFYRGQREEVLSRILVLAPVAEYPAPEVLK